MDVQTKRVVFNELQQQRGEYDYESGDDYCSPQETSVEELSNESEPVTTFPLSLLKEVLIVILTVFYMADIALDIWVAVRFFALSDHPMNAWFVVFCILLPNLYAGYKSLQWYLRAHDYDPIRRPLPWIIRIFFFPLSILLRYYDTWHYGRQCREARKLHEKKEEKRFFTAYLIESSEVSMLRLFTIFLEDAPIAVLNLKGVILTPPDVQKHRMEMVFVVIFKLVFTMSIGVVHFITSTKAVYHAAKSEQYFLMGSQWIQKNREDYWEERGFLSVPAEICIYLWHLCGIGARLVAYAMFVAVYPKQLWILVGIRWLLNTIWIKIDAWEISLTNCIAFGGVYLFSFVPTSPKRQLLRILLYYGFTWTENVIIAVLFSNAMYHSPYGPGGFAFMFCGTFLSMVFMSIYYGCFHPRKSNLKLYEWYLGRRSRTSASA